MQGRLKNNKLCVKYDTKVGKLTNVAREFKGSKKKDLNKNRVKTVNKRFKQNTQLYFHLIRKTNQ